jgi:dihydroorotase
VLKWAAEDKVPLAAAIACITSRPAEMLGSAAGHLGVGAPADVCLFDAATHWRVEPSALVSQGKNTPFIGLEVPGKVRMTIVGGHIVYER